jgi:drug/metabolite transporter (DMT)-like permease
MTTRFALPLRVFSLTALAMLAFAGNSLLCRLALQQTEIDPANFTTIRLASGAAVLWIVVKVRHGALGGRGSFASALALFAYAACFSFAYIDLTAATGALLLFGAVQATMIGVGLWRGDRLHGRQIGGVGAAIIGLIGLLLPGFAAPPPAAATLMLIAGIAWGVYSLRGRGETDPTTATAGNFLRAAPMALILSFVLANDASFDRAGVLYAVASGALTSGLGYVIWYAALPALSTASAAVVQLCVPVITTLGGLALLSEPITARVVLSSAAILGGVALVVLSGKRSAAPLGTGRIDTDARRP